MSLLNFDVDFFSAQHQAHAPRCLQQLSCTAYIVSLKYLLKNPKAKDNNGLSKRTFPVDIKPLHY